MLIPEWMTGREEYTPAKDKDGFIAKSLLSMFGALSRIKLQGGREGTYSPHAAWKLALSFVVILLMALSEGLFFPVSVLAVLLLRLCMLPGDRILAIGKPAAAASALSFAVLLPSLLLGNTVGNVLRLLCKVFDTVTVLSLLTRTTTWNHLTGGLKSYHVPDVFILTLDLAIKYIVLLGELCVDMLQALRLRSVGRNPHKRKSVSGIMGTVFLKSGELTEEMYQAMACRGYCGTYRKNVCHGNGIGNAVCAVGIAAAAVVFLLIGS